MSQTRRGFFSSLGAVVAMPAAAAVPEPKTELYTKRYVVDKIFDLPVHLAVKVDDWKAIDEGRHPRYSSADHLAGRLSHLRLGDLEKMPRSHRRNLRRRFKEISNVTSNDG